MTSRYIHSKQSEIPTKRILCSEQCESERNNTVKLSAKSISIFAIGMTITFAVFAESTAISQTSAVNTAAAISGALQNQYPQNNIDNDSRISVQIKTEYCPKENTLVQDKKLIWSAPGGWESFAPSFVKKIGTFISAQWTGIKYGKIICIYQGENSFEFPVALEQKISKLYLHPEGHSWNLSIKEYIICKSNNIYDCPFYIREEEEKISSSSEIYNQLQYKGSIAPVNSPSNQ